MNRKSKIIVSVVGITIVLLALLGITYAYYLTRIEGNTNTNSISVSTADLKLKYDNGNGNIVENANFVLINPQILDSVDDSSIDATHLKDKFITDYSGFDDIHTAEQIVEGGISTFLVKIFLI